MRNTILECLASHAETRGSRRAFAEIDSNLEISTEVTFADLYAIVALTSNAYRNRVEYGDRILLLCESGLTMLTAFLSCMMAGAIPVPVHVPRPRRGVERLLGIIDNSDCSAYICDQTGRRLAGGDDEIALRLEALADLPAPEILMHAQQSFVLPDRLCDVAFLQYTSGSTSSPKGVVVSQDNVMANQRMIQSGFGHDADTIFGSWLPMFHDMGLIGGVLHPLYLGVSCYYMKPTRFLQRPMRWIEMNARYGVTTSGAPNFAYSQIVQRLKQDELAEIDLSAWRVAFNGSEPVRAHVFRDFAAALEPAGFDARALFPCYGMAETTLFVSGAHLRQGQKTKWLNTKALGEGTAQFCSESDSAVEIVSCGPPAIGGKILILDPATGDRETDGSIGEICLNGPHIAQGYFAPKNQSGCLPLDAWMIEDENWFRTGDLGFVFEEELYIVGRLKEMFIINGRNIFPHDIEVLAAGMHPLLARGNVVALSVDHNPTERIVLVLELDWVAVDDLEKQSALDAVRLGISKSFDIVIDELVLARIGQVPRTTSGKVRRADCASIYLADGFDTC